MIPFKIRPRYIVAYLALAASAYGGPRWEPVDPADLALREPTIDPASNIEIILKDVRIDDTSSATRVIFSNYMKLKVFNDAGVEELSKIDIPFADNRIRRIEGRVVKPDGTIIELEKDAIYTREIIRKGSERVRVKSFSFRGLEPGSIVEYRWEESARGSIFGIKLDFQSEWAARQVRYRVRPFMIPGYELRAIYHLCSEKSFDRDSRGYCTFEEFNVPAIRKEPFAPPVDTVTRWMTLFYLPPGVAGEYFWGTFGAALFDQTKSEIKPDRNVRRLADEIAAGMDDYSRKLPLFYDYCVSQIRNTSLDATDDDADDKSFEFQKPGKTIKEKAGSPYEINLLFASLAQAADFDVRMALVVDRSRCFFDRSFQAPSAMPDVIVAVKLGEQWMFFNPGAGIVPSQELEWKNENVMALIGNKTGSVMVTTPGSDENDSRAVRTADLKIDEQGNLTGNVSIEYTGHLAVIKKAELGRETSEGRRKFFEDDYSKRLGTIEISNLEFENLEGTAQPVMVRFDIEVPRFGQRTGTRIFIQPSFFEKGKVPVFVESERVYDVYFPFSWSEEDEVRIGLPEGYELEDANAPESAEVPDLLGYKVELALLKKENALRFRREYSFTGRLLKGKLYPALKELFDELQTREQHTITLREISESDGEIALRE